MSADEIDLVRSIELASKGASVYVFINSFADIDYVKEVLGSGQVTDVDLGEARGIMLEQSSEDPAEMKRKFDGSVIVCPHGRTSLRFVHALKRYGVTAYSLHGGIEGLKSGV